MITHRYYTSMYIVPISIRLFIEDGWHFFLKVGIFIKLLLNIIAEWLY